ncbi:MAG: hypothetical protein H7062_19975 [Candidatus Saccharimonas sp.]|nr:hypothetical protein [Planctomycetaceae bacterium]
MATVDYTCVCGKQMRFKAEHAGKKTRCPDCEATITVPSSADDDAEDYDDHEEESATIARPPGSITSVTGRRAVASFGGQIVPSMFGTTTLEIDGARLIETTQSILSQRHAELLLTEVDSAEFRVTPNPALLGAGIALLPVFGLGLLVLPFYFFIKYKFLIIHSGSNTTVVAITGNESPYRDFMDNVLSAAEAAKQRHLAS